MIQKKCISKFVFYLLEGLEQFQGLQGRVNLVGVWSYLKPTGFKRLLCFKVLKGGGVEFLKKIACKNKNVLVFNI